MYFSLQRKYMVCILFTNNMRHNVCIALRIYCPFLLQKLHIYINSAFWPTLNWSIVCWDLKIPNRKAAAIHFLCDEWSNMFQVLYYFPSHSKRRTSLLLLCSPHHFNIPLTPKNSRHFQPMWVGNTSNCCNFHLLDKY